MSKVKDLFEDEAEFEELLEQAEDAAESDWEMNFVSGIREKYDDFESDMFLSEKQLSILEKIANQ